MERGDCKVNGSTGYSFLSTHPLPCPRHFFFLETSCRMRLSLSQFTGLFSHFPWCFLFRTFCSFLPFGACIVSNLCIIFRVSVHCALASNVVTLEK